MTTPSNTDLREAIRKLLKQSGRKTIEEGVYELEALFQAREQQLLTELKEQAVEVNTVQYNYENGDKMIAGFTNSAVPVSVIEAKLKQTNDGGTNGKN